MRAKKKKVRRFDIPIFSRHSAIFYDMAEEATGWRWLCCTWAGMEKLKRTLSLVVGALVLTSSILSIVLNALNFLGIIRSAWNCLFGTLMILVQFNFTKWIARRFGFLTGWFGRGMFFLL